jgi:hypothetical protein
MQTSVVEALKAAGLYKETGRIEEQMVKTLTASGELKEHKMAEMDYLDIKTFADELEIALKLQNPLVQSLYAKNAEGLVNLIRTVNVESASGFKGSVGSGRQLDAIMLRAVQFYDPDNVGTRRVDWTRAIAVLATTNALYFIESSAGGGAALAMGDDEGLAILGFANPAQNPVSDALQITYISQTYNIQNLDFELANVEIGDVIVELKQPLFVYPKEDFAIKVRYFATGTDELRPIGLWVKMSSDLRALATS